MFLTGLSKQEGVAFINLISEFAIADHKLCIEERVLIEDACEEMGLTDDDLVNMSLEEATEILKDSTKRVKKIVYFELIRLGLVDEDFDIHEVEFLNDIADRLEVKRSVRFAFAGYFFNYSDTDRLNTEEARTDALTIIGHNRA